MTVEAAVHLDIAIKGRRGIDRADGGRHEANASRDAQVGRSTVVLGRVRERQHCQANSEPSDSSV
jgi:hypothetical protein